MTTAGRLARAAATAAGGGMLAPEVLEEPLRTGKGYLLTQRKS